MATVFSTHVICSVDSADKAKVGQIDSFLEDIISKHEGKRYFIKETRPVMRRSGDGYEEVETGRTATVYDIPGLFKLQRVDVAGGYGPFIRPAQVKYIPYSAKSDITGVFTDFFEHVTGDKPSFCFEDRYTVHEKIL